EVAVSIDEDVPAGTRLRKPDQCFIDGRIAVRVILTHYVADRGSGLPVSLVRGQSLLVHPVNDAPVHRFKTVTHIRQRSAYYDRHRVVDERPPHLVTQLNRDNPFAGQWSTQSEPLLGMSAKPHASRLCTGNAGSGK